MYRFWFADIEGISNSKKKRLVEAIGSEQALYQATAEQVRKTAVLSEEELKLLQTEKSTEKLKRAQKNAEKEGIKLVTITDEKYPERLKPYRDAPYCLYYKGSLPADNQRSAAIVGARMCTAYGRVMARKIAARLAECGVQIISGMARGIDRYGHEGALEVGKPTFAVMGNGVDICYPPENRELYKKIERTGGILSEYKPGTEPKPYFFPARNRIISAMADIVIVIEAKEKSGSLITADFALEQGKDVFVVPGRLGDPLSLGCNQLIKQGAQIICSTEDLLADLQILPLISEGKEDKKNLTLEKDETLVYSCLGLTPKSIECLLSESGIKLPILLRILKSLQVKGMIEEYYRNSYIRRV